MKKQTKKLELMALKFEWDEYKRKNMSKSNTDSNNESMREAYDFSDGVRGKHYKAYREGHSVQIHKKKRHNIVTILHPGRWLSHLRPGC